MFQGWRRSTGLPSGSLGDADAEIDRDQIVGDELAVHDDARRHEHLAAPVRHVLVLEVAVIGILVGAPAA
jgi:hypothetical protein